MNKGQIDEYDLSTNCCYHRNPIAPVFDAAQSGIAPAE
jgi:hypothetical protein